MVRTFLINETAARVDSLIYTSPQVQIRSVKLEKFSTASEHPFAQSINMVDVITNDSLRIDPVFEGHPDSIQLSSRCGLLVTKGTAI